MKVTCDMTTVAWMMCSLFSDQYTQRLKSCLPLESITPKDAAFNGVMEGGGGGDDSWELSFSVPRKEFKKLNHQLFLHSV